MPQCSAETEERSVAMITDIQGLLDENEYMLHLGEINAAEALKFLDVVKQRLENSYHEVNEVFKETRVKVVTGTASQDDLRKIPDSLVEKWKQK